jgi:hypothetical protein
MRLFLKGLLGATAHLAARHVKFENTFNGTLRGGVISCGPEEIIAGNHSSFTIDHGKNTEVPAGFVLGKRRLVPHPDSYVEY